MAMLLTLMFVPGALPLRFGWHDCQGDIPNAHSVKRALRKEALSTHPDKVDGSNAAFLRTQEMRRLMLGEPLRFHALHALSFGKNGYNRTLHKFKDVPDSMASPGDAGCTMESNDVSSASDAGDASSAGDANGDVGNTSVPSPVRGVRAYIFEQNGWPYLNIDLDFVLDEQAAGGRWAAALSAENVSTIVYTGRGGGDGNAADDLQAQMRDATHETSRVTGKGVPRGAQLGWGYDICCHFKQRSGCMLQAYPGHLDEDATELGASETMGAPTGVESHRAHESAGAISATALYATHDCPLPSSFTATVRKPLHVQAAGRWGVAIRGTLLLASGQQQQFCASLVTRYRPRCERDAMGEAQCPGPDSDSDSDSAPNSSSSPDSNGAAEEHDSKHGYTYDTSQTQPTSNESSTPPRRESMQTPTFTPFSQGTICVDGADILEGSLDSYSVCDPHTGLCSLSKRCREKCRRRKRCKFFTTFSSGWCHLSTRCSAQEKSADASARTYIKSYS